MNSWRISGYADLEGKGGLNFASRWNHVGQTIVYTADHPSTALLEILVNVDFEDLPETYQLLKISIPDEAPIKIAKLKANWQKDVQYTRDFWSNFCAKSTEIILKVPSVITPYTYNYLINPNKVKKTDIKIEIAETHNYDKRFMIKSK
jgi:RES domain-containing protein